MSVGWTIKYGILIPSVEVASNCSTTCREGSNLGGKVLINFREPEEASVSQRELGVRKPLALTNARFDVSSAAPYPMVKLSGRSSLPRLQPPSAVGLYTHARPRTLSSVARSSLSCVALTPRSDS